MSIPPCMKVIFQHDENCPKGRNGLLAYWEARDALSSLPPEARNTDEDCIAITIAEFDLENKQVCNCGCDEARKLLEEDDERT